MRGTSVHDIQSLAIEKSQCVPFPNLLDCRTAQNFRMFGTRPQKDPGALDSWMFFRGAKVASMRSQAKCPHPSSDVSARTIWSLRVKSKWYCRFLSPLLSLPQEQRPNCNHNTINRPLLHELYDSILYHIAIENSSLTVR